MQEDDDEASSAMEEQGEDEEQGGADPYAKWEHDHNDECEECDKGGDLLLCDFCNVAYHMTCLDPELSAPPDGDWACPGYACDQAKAPLPTAK